MVRQREMKMTLAANNQTNAGGRQGGYYGSWPRKKVKLSSPMNTFVMNCSWSRFSIRRLTFLVSKAHDDVRRRQRDKRVEGVRKTKQYRWRLDENSKLRTLPQQAIHQYHSSLLGLVLSTQGICQRTEETKRWEWKEREENKTLYLTIGVKIANQELSPSKLLYINSHAFHLPLLSFSSPSSGSCPSLHSSGVWWPKGYSGSRSKQKYVLNTWVGIVPPSAPTPVAGCLLHTSDSLHHRTYFRLLTNFSPFSRLCFVLFSVN